MLRHSAEKHDSSLFSAKMHAMKIALNNSKIREFEDTLHKHYPHHEALDIKINEPNYDYFFERNRRVIIIAYILTKMLETIAPKSPWKENFFSLLEKYPSYPGIPMGFSSELKLDLFWEM